MNVEQVEDLDDPRLADYRGVRDPVRLREAGVFLVEGRHSVEVLFTRSPFPARSLLCAPKTVRWLETAAFDVPEHVRVFSVSAETLRGLTGHRFHQGCVAAGVRPAPRTAGALLLDTALPSRLLVLHDVSNPDNVGAIFRSAAAFHAGGVALSAPCASPLYRKAIRTSMGATLTVPFSHHGDGPETVRALQEGGYTVAALMPASDTVVLGDFVSSGLPQRLALLLGSEGYGLDRVTTQAADVRVRIPIDPQVDSLNVAAAAAIALHATAHPIS